MYMMVGLKAFVFIAQLEVVEVHNIHGKIISGFSNTPIARDQS